jgi:phage tail-like protein
MPQTGQRVDPIRNFNFLVEIQGIAQASFTECTGLGSTTQVIEHREGGDNTTTRKLPGTTTYTDISLKYGVTSSTELLQWRQQIIDGTILRLNGSIVAYDLDTKTEMARWNFVRAWPTKWEGPSFNAKGNDVAIDTLVLAHEGLTRV